MILKCQRGTYYRKCDQQQLGEMSSAGKARVVKICNAKINARHVTARDIWRCVKLRKRKTTEFRFQSHLEENYLPTFDESHVLN